MLGQGADPIDYLLLYYLIQSAEPYRTFLKTVGLIATSVEEYCSIVSATDPKVTEAKKYLSQGTES
ncbi:hypothetical protein GCM10007938_18850 [Vibrio zhanjiangensis]|uniref:Uncharacterized protein n=1 Tax=Vibrio zhanjiangensis TaxID=1046128 RepID=A0ABQ6EYL8_9VIBR|nr:hypothetical protein GCM10007938_18850 [Vibrio zhanjiangensis]